jgi:hypothetical protein
MKPFGHHPPTTCTERAPTELSRVRETRMPALRSECILHACTHALPCSCPVVVMGRRASGSLLRGLHHHLCTQTWSRQHHLHVRGCAARNGPGALAMAQPCCSAACMYATKCCPQPRTRPSPDHAPCAMVRPFGCMARRLALVRLITLRRSTGARTLPSPCQVLDSMGWLGYPKRPFHWARAVGVALLIGGLVLVAHFDGEP